MKEPIVWSVYYFDFEASTDGAHHLPYCVCYQSADGVEEGFWYGKDCAYKFLQTLPNNSICYAHNLSYDITFLINHFDFIYDNPIIKSGRTYSLTASFNNRTLKFKDSYSIVSAPLRLFPSMFNLDSGRKEVFPYGYYNSSRIGDIKGNINEALAFIHEADHQSFIDNVKDIAYVNEEIFNMKKYCVFYCNQDVTILRKGFEWFRNALLNEFGLDVHNFVSISSIANRYMEMKCYWLNGNLYDLSNTPREFISRCIIGGRCMLADNAPQITSGEPVVDFDAVSLYPSAIHRLYTLEGIPNVLTPEMLNQKYLLNHLFTDDQTEPTAERNISGFFIEAKIESVGNDLHFPLIVWNPECNNGVEHDRATNAPCTMYMDHITFEDLIHFHKATIKPIRGYYYNNNRDHTIRDVIEELFELRLRYKREGNPLQVIIKLLLNSVYGKCILKPIDTKTKFIPKYEKDRYLRNRYHYIKELSGSNRERFMIATEFKPYSKHFAFVPLGVNILSMSKRIMSEVMCTAEAMDIKIFYTDTDSFHLYQKDLPLLEKQFRRVYGRELIGSRLGQFHSDFALVNGHPSMPVAMESVFVMKKTYIDQLVNPDGDVAFHCRMKGVPLDVIVNRANELYDGTRCYVKDGLVYGTPCLSFADTGSGHEVSSEGAYPIVKVHEFVHLKDSYTILQLYHALLSGDEIEFDLTSGSRPCFDLSNFEVKTKESFTRNVKI